MCSAAQSFATPSDSISASASRPSSQTVRPWVRRRALGSGSADDAPASVDGASAGSIKNRAETTESSTQNRPVQVSVTPVGTPAPSVAAPMTAAIAPPIDHIAWKAAMIGRG